MEVEIFDDASEYLEWVDNQFDSWTFISMNVHKDKLILTYKRR